MSETLTEVCAAWRRRFVNEDLLIPLLGDGLTWLVSLEVPPLQATLAKALISLERGEGFLDLPVELGPCMLWIGVVPRDWLSEESAGAMRVPTEMLVSDLIVAVHAHVVGHNGLFPVAVGEGEPRRFLTIDYETMTDLSQAIRDGNCIRLYPS